MDVALLLVYAAPVALAALGEAVSQRGGVINIGLEGMMLAGAFFGMLVAHDSGSPMLGIAAGAAVGLVLALLASGFAVVLAADQVVVGTAINLLSLGLTGTLFRARFGESGQLLSVPRLPPVFGVDAIVILLILLTPLTWLLLRRTAFGLALRAAGEYPKAVEAAGFSVSRLRLAGLAVSGAMGGVAGAYLAIGVAGSFAENMTAGRGFVAIAMVTFGRWNPILVLAAALVVGYAESLQFALQARNVGVPYQFFVALPYLLALAVLVIAGRGESAPRALGLVYRRDR